MDSIQKRIKSERPRRTAGHFGGNSVTKKKISFFFSSNSRRGNSNVQRRFVSHLWECGPRFDRNEMKWSGFSSFFFFFLFLLLLLRGRTFAAGRFSVLFPFAHFFFSGSRRRTQDPISLGSQFFGVFFLIELCRVVYWVFTGFLRVLSGCLLVLWGTWLCFYWFDGCFFCVELGEFFFPSVTGLFFCYRVLVDLT